MLFKKESNEKIQPEIHPLFGGWLSEKFTGRAGEGPGKIHGRRRGGPRTKFTGPAGEGQQKNSRAPPGRGSKQFTGPAREGPKNTSRAPLGRGQNKARARRLRNYTRTRAKRRKSAMQL